MGYKSTIKLLKEIKEKVKIEDKELLKKIDKEIEKSGNTGGLI